MEFCKLLGECEWALKAVTQPAGFPLSFEQCELFPSVGSEQLLGVGGWDPRLLHIPHILIWENIYIHLPSVLMETSWISSTAVLAESPAPSTHWFVLWSPVSCWFITGGCQWLRYWPDFCWSRSRAQCLPCNHCLLRHTRTFRPSLNKHNSDTSLTDLKVKAQCQARPDEIADAVRTSCTDWETDT